MTTAVYLRISEDRLGLELGVDRQRADCLDLVLARGWPEPREFTDNDFSATSGRRRPAYEALMAAVDRREVARVVVWHSSRLWRNRKERADGIERFKAARASLVAVRGPELDLATAAGRGMAALLGEFDTMEVEIHSERAVAEVRQRAERGEPHGGPRRYGYTANGRALVDDEAANVRRWFTETLAGRSITSIARESGKHHSAIRVILTNPKNAGLRVLHGVEYPGSWPAIVTPEVWRAVNAMLSDPARRSNTNRTARRWLGSGLYECERCNGKPVGIVSNNRTKSYGCLSIRGGCSRRWRAEPIDDFVTNLVTARLGEPDVADLLPRDRPDQEALRTEAMAIRERLKQVSAKWAVAAMTDEQLRSATAAGRARLADIETELGAAGGADALTPLLLADDPAAAWLAIPVDQVARRQAVVRGLMTVTLGTPIRGRAPWDPERFLFLEWRRVR